MNRELSNMNALNESSRFKQPRRIRLSVVLIAAGVVCFVMLAFGALWLSYLFFQPVVLEEGRIVVVEKGEALSSLAERLKRDGMIRSSSAFHALFSLVYPTATIKAGEYRLSEKSTLLDTALLFMHGTPSNERSITIIEGWTLFDIGRYLEKEGIVSQDEFIRATQNGSTAQFSFLPSPVRAPTLEGYLFPDTYRIFEKGSAEDIVIRMLENFEAHYSPAMAAQTKALKRDMHDSVTLASILEREVRGEKDRRIVADLFYRRLVKGMPLQADSTINYITGRKDAQARLVDLEIDSPYNTYTHKGLPPGPIGNPGLEAIQAALSPIENPFWFFLTTPEGEVIYSKTFEEHIKNKLKYLSKQ